MQRKGFLAGLLVPVYVMAADSLYCPQHQGYISLDMTPDQVIAACGQPADRMTAQLITQRIPMEQRMYQHIPTSSTVAGYPAVETTPGGTVPGQIMIYKMYSELPAGSMGLSASLQVDIVEDKVIGVHINGNSSSATTLCGGVRIQEGDPISSVNAACGEATFTNQSYITRVVSSAQHPEVWAYQVNKYQPSVRLTFIGGRLQSIENDVEQGG